VKKSLDIRELRKDDFQAVMEIDEMIRGFSRPDYWQRRFINAESIPPWASLVADVREPQSNEADNRMVGFLFGWSSMWDFGLRDEVGWIDVIGVHPAYRFGGIGRALVNEFNRLAKDRRRVEKVFTLVDPAEAETSGFFSQIGFARGKLIQMERSSGHFYPESRGPNGSRTLKIGKNSRISPNIAKPKKDGKRV